MNRLKDVFCNIADKKFDCPLAPLSTFKIGGNAEVLLSPASVEELAQILTDCRRHEIRYCILGGGSNVLISDKGFHGAVVRIGQNFAKVQIEGNLIFAQAGARLSSISQIAARHGLAGLEFCSGIPGTLGGGLVMNAGAYGGEMSMVTSSADFLKGGRHVKLEGASCRFSYRSSLFSEDSDCVVTGGVLTLKKDSKDAILARMRDNNRKRSINTPIGQPSAGSAFKRPKNDFAARLIEEAGLKGHQIGGAMISLIHSGFVVNTGGATSKDVLALLDFAADRVYKKFGVKLQREIKLLGDF